MNKVNNDFCVWPLPPLLCLIFVGFWMISRSMAKTLPHCPSLGRVPNHIFLLLLPHRHLRLPLPRFTSQHPFHSLHHRFLNRVTRTNNWHRISLVLPARLALVPVLGQATCCCCVTFLLPKPMLGLHALLAIRCIRVQWMLRFISR